MKYSNQIDSKFKALIDSQFGDYMVASFINGRAAFRMAEPTMDIDTFVILDDNILNNKEIFKKKWVNFVKGYRDIHVEFGFKPDNSFPGDFVTVSQLYDVANGRGFVKKDGQIYLQPMSSIKDESNENDYRIFRSMLIIGRYLSGNEAFLNEMKILSLNCLIKYIFIKRSKISLEEILNELLSGKEKELYGYDKRYEPHFNRYMRPRIKQTLNYLLSIGYIKILNDELYEGLDAIFNWGKIVASRNWTAEHLLEFGDSYYSIQSKKIFTGYNAGSHWEKLK